MTSSKSLQTDSNNSLPNATILIVDDDKNGAVYIADLMETFGYRSVVCHHGADALVKAQETPIDLVLLDVMMPDMDGYTVAPQLKKIFGANNFVPIILLTALSTQVDKLRGLACADDFITKPFNSEELLARIRVMLRIRDLQRALIISKSNYQFLYENAPYLYVTIDASGTITDCNSLFCSKTGLARTEIVGKSLELFFKAEDRSLMSAIIRGPLADRAQNRRSPALQLIGKDASEPIYVELGAVSANETIMISMQDVTQNITLEKEQKIARTQLYRSARLASIGTFASGVAHELNNPLTAILGFSNALLERVKHDESIDKSELAQYLEIISNESIRCRDIVENLSRFAREGDVQIRQFDLVGCINGAMRLVNSRAVKKQVTLSSVVADGIKVLADSQKLEQAIVYIISNSLDFCASGSMVSIEAFPDKPYVKLCISDNGPGIAPDALPKIFDPFFSTKVVGQGMGLGLAMSHVIMEECNGGIDVISEQGQGTTVILDIPAA